MPDDDVALVEDLVRKLPELRPSFDEHLAIYDELLTHVFFGDVSRWAIQTNRETPTSPRLAELLAYLNAALGAGAPDTRALIEQSFLENICEEDDLATKLPALLAARYQAICGVPIRPSS